MASKYTTILADIKAKMESIANIGIIHDYYRWSNNPAKFAALFSFTTSGKKHIRGWEITRVQVPERKGAVKVTLRHHKFMISGYMGVNDEDATDKIFQPLVDDVCEKFRDDPGGGAWYYMNGDEPGNSPCQVQAIDVRIFGNVLCHHADILLSVTEHIIPV